MNLPWKKTNSTLSPFTRGFDSPIQQIFDEFFNEVGSPLWNETPSRRFIPKINVSETENEYKISAELPGLDQKDFEVHLEDNILRIRGERKTSQEHADAKYTRFESSYGAFERAFSLPQEVDPEKIHATFKNGILNITLSKVLNSPKSRRIEIETH